MQFKPIIAENNVEIAICSQIFSMTIKLRKLAELMAHFLSA